jgi:hypothetical protein
VSQHAHHAPKVHLGAHTVDDDIKLTLTLLKGGVELLETAFSQQQFISKMCSSCAGQGLTWGVRRCDSERVRKWV